MFDHDHNRWIILYSVESTNSYLLKRASELASGTICFTDKQTCGRGRQGRQWLSGQDSGQSFLFSGLIKKNTITFDWKAQALFFSYVATIALKEFLPSTWYHNRDICLCWPNDIYICNHQGGLLGKVGGVLVEQELLANEQIFVIGLGINWHAGDYLVNVKSNNQKPATIFEHPVKLYSCRNFLPVWISTVNQLSDIYLHNQQKLFDQINNIEFLVGKSIRVLNCDYTVAGIHLDGSLNITNRAQLDFLSDEEIKNKIIADYV